MISDLILWLEFNHLRNQTAEAYNAKVAQYIYDIAIQFLPASHQRSRQLWLAELSHKFQNDRVVHDGSTPKIGDLAIQ